jgi:predicted GIY-YIG superfamily endonuclease
VSRSKPSWLATVLGDAYTLHFWPPYGDPEVQQAGHYTGWAEEGRLNRRLTDHVLGRGARLTQVQREVGGTWVVADIERGVTRDRETQLKERGASRRCSVCKASRDIEAGRATKEQALAKWPNASPAERGILREIFGMEPEPAKAPEPVKEFVPAPRPEPAAEIPPDIDALIDVLVAGWKAEAASPKAPEVVPESEMEMEAEAG